MSLKEYQLRLAYAARTNNQGRSFCVALAGIITGCCLAAVVIFSLPVSLAPLEQAQQLGITSETVLEGYPKHQEFRNYCIGLAVITSTALTVWIAWALMITRRRKHPNNSPQIRIPVQPVALSSKPPILFIFDYVFLPLVFLLLTYNLAHKTGFGSLWMFLGEEGLNLNAINAILSGQALYKDIFHPNGPLVVYPTVFLMKTFGVELIIARIYTALLAIIACGIIYFLLRRIVCHRITVLFFFFSFFFHYFPGANFTSGSTIRFVIPIIALLPLYAYLSNKKPFLVFVAGVTVGCGLFFNHERGVVAGLAGITVLFVDSVYHRKSLRIIINRLINYCIGIALIAVPILLYLNYQQALSAYFFESARYIKYVTLGHDCTPFPRLLNIPNNLWTAFHYWPILLYICVGTHLALSLCASRWSNRHTILTGLWIAGILSFRSAFVRSGILSIKGCLAPTILLCAVYSEIFARQAYTLLKERTIRRKYIPAAGWFSLSLILILFCSPGPFLRSKIKALSSPLTLSGVTARFTRNGWKNLDLDRAHNIYVPNEYYAIKEVVEYITANTTATDYVYAFPNEGTYNFLTNRRNPARYSMSYQAATTAIRQDEVRRLQQNKPKYVIYTTDRSMYIYGIPAKIKVPEIISYIQSNYKTEKIIGTTRVMRRKEK